MSNRIFLGVVSFARANEYADRTHYRIEHANLGEILRSIWNPSRCLYDVEIGYGIDDTEWITMSDSDPVGIWQYTD